MEQNAMMKYAAILFMMSMCRVSPVLPQTGDPLSFPFDKKYGQVEVGGPFAGAEFHRSRPLPSRISLYYPAANSIDLSTDYWKRDESMPMAFGVRIGNGKKRWIGREPWQYVLSPHAVSFTNNDSILAYGMTYEFCRTEPAMVVSVTLTNRTRQPQHITAYAHLLLVLRTCQTYTRKDSAMMRFPASGQSVVASFKDTDTRSASVFVLNASEKARSVWIDADQLSITDTGTSNWIDSAFSSRHHAQSLAGKARAAAAFEYVVDLAPGGSITITLVIGSAYDNEVEQKITRLANSWKEETDSFNESVRNYALAAAPFSTGDAVFDRSVQWSKAILTTNAHYLNGTIVPMPCPAEYNFFFTHDLLMTDLGAVNFDPIRVKRDLFYVASLAQDSIIPHGYYWRDDGFKTELCTPSNWNHLWFIELSARYLRHSLDTAALRRLFPLITKSLSEVMTQLREDGLMHAFRPDWWDIGWNEGPRTYITALGIRQIENVLFMASMIDPSNPSLGQLEKKSTAMRTALTEKLWDDTLKFLINFNGREKDSHKYMGSLLAPALHLLDIQRGNELIASAKKDLLAPGIGIRAAMPADFHTDSSIAYFKFAGKEAGDAYTYINGGVWPHNNAWFALALNAVGRSREAAEFVKRTMTIDGIAASPNGVPAMYEYRFSDESSPRYGEIDKPSFLWAGGFYLYTMYSLAGMNENVWNLSFAEHAAPFDSTIRAAYSFGTQKKVEISGRGNRVQTIQFDKKNIPSLVIPLDQHSTEEISVQKGNIAAPYVKRVDAILHSVKHGKRTMTCVVSSFGGHRTNMEIVSPKKPAAIFLNGKALHNALFKKAADGCWETIIPFTAGKGNDHLNVKW